MKRKYKFDSKKQTQYAIGALHMNQNKNEKIHPDHLGELDIPKILLSDLISQMNTTGTARISLASYNNQNQSTKLSPLRNQRIHPPQQEVFSNESFARNIS